MAGVTAAAAGGAATATGFGLFGYNRENYMYDAEFRYERFSAGREFAIEQMDMYREDLRKLSELTAKKCGLYSIFASLGMALCVALYCAGRLGLHGPSPPMHVMGLWLTCNAAAFAYYVVAIWLSVHACYRASAATTQLLTRRARVPVPSLKQLDRARRFASEFEQQDWSDIFRIPYPRACPSGRSSRSARARSRRRGGGTRSPPGSGMSSTPTRRAACLGPRRRPPSPTPRRSTSSCTPTCRSTGSSTTSTPACRCCTATSRSCSPSVTTAWATSTSSSGLGGWPTPRRS
ncbi:unnamed protein product [Prorocentrum cordatum]|uniref:Uncharacterized protein n=1 Tax=Prorocentrum cordatum TaxID=2364126 RepID=A0ABN9T6X6_9DINO|nr:unnamed protein product [Polarella glacialis]